MPETPEPERLAVLAALIAPDSRDERPGVD
jgi:hypothetical protein